MSTVGAKVVVVTGRTESDIGISAFEGKLNTEIATQEAAGFEVYETQVHHHSVSGIAEVLAYMWFVLKGSSPGSALVITTDYTGTLAGSATTFPIATGAGVIRIVKVESRISTPGSSTEHGLEVKVPAGGVVQLLVQQTKTKLFPIVEDIFELVDSGPFETDAGVITVSLLLDGAPADVGGIFKLVIERLG